MNQFLHRCLLFFLLTTSYSLIAQKKSPSTTDSNIRSFRTLHIQGKWYTVFLVERGCFVLDVNKDTIFRQEGDYFTMKCSDFNKDGFQDIFLDKGGNTPEVYDLLLYDPDARNFKMVKDFELFPSPVSVSGTKFFYSYHKNGCADMDWVSDLFYLDHFRAILIGKIHCSGCKPEINMPIYIYKMVGLQKTLLKTLPGTVIAKYKDNKWGFIKEYWSKRYAQFL